MSWPQWPAGGQPNMVNTAGPLINPAPAVVAPGLQYTQDQWAQMQQQNWQQWAQWQQQYQQWHQQYGAEYQKSMNALNTTVPPQSIQHTLPGLPNVGVPPPLPVENKPPLPLDDPPPPTHQPPPLMQIQTKPPPPQQQQQQQQMYSTGSKISNYSTVPPPKITNFSQQINQNNNRNNNNWSTQTNNNNTRFSNDNNKRSFDSGGGGGVGVGVGVGGNEMKRSVNESNNNQWQNQQSINTNQKLVIKDNLEQLSEAEKKFDKQFADWEAQFNKWKEQNAEHPDKDQYREYEKKWENWRAQLLERREQMKRKRLSLTSSATNNSSSPNNNNNNKFRQHNFSQPPPPTPPISSSSSTTTTSGQLLKNVNYNKPPPNMNNEPLKFNKQNELLDNNNSSGNNDFFKPINNNDGGIPGLDLVDDVDERKSLNKNNNDLVINDKELNDKKGPDFDAISKGINTILGDEKLLSMLSMVSTQNLNLKTNDSIIDTFSKINKDNDNNKITNTSVIDNNTSFNNNNNEQLSNLSHDDKSNHSDHYNNQTREFVNNFDDQTRSSFTMANNEIDMRYDNNNRNNNFDNRGGGGGNNDYYNNKNSFNNRNSNNYNNNNNNNFDYNNERQFGLRDNNCDNFNRQNQFNISSSSSNNNNNNNNRNFNNRGGNFNNINDDKYDQMNDYYQNDYDMGQDYQDNNDQNFNYDQRVNESFDEFNEQNCEKNPPKPPQETVIDDDILKPVTVIDYDHKPLKPPEPEVLIEPIRMFDYRHKQLNRIPFPQRPKWLSEEVKNIREFDPPIVRSYELSSNLRRYSKDPYDYRSSYDDRWPTGYGGGSTRRNYNEITHQLLGERRPPPPLLSSSLYERKHLEHDNWSNCDDNMKKDEMYDRFSNDSKRFNERHSFNETRNNNSNKYDDRKSIQSYKDMDRMKYYDDIDDYDKCSQQEISSCQDHNIDDNLKIEKLIDIGNKNDFSTHVTMIEDLINIPGRYKRPPRIVIILRGPPGSGKTFLAKLIKDKEVENGGSPPRILSLDDYFMIEHEKEITEDGKRIKIKDMIYEYEANMEESYRTSLVKSFKKTITDGYFPFIIVDNVNDKVKYFGEMWSFAKQNGFQVYICQLELDVQSCTKRNIHGRTEKEIQECVDAWEPTPTHHPTLDATSLIQSGSIPEVEMEEINSPATSDECNEDGSEDQVFRSKWDNFDCSVDNLAKLDGVHKPLRHHESRTMEEYLQMECDWNPVESKPGKKRVRWADLEEQREQKKMRALGFVVGQTNWDRIMDTSMGSSALTQTKYFDKSGYY